MTQQEYAVRADALKGKLYGMAFLYLGSQSLAVDAVDEAVYLGLRSCHKLREDAFFDTWLTRILINACNAELRRHKREIAMAELPETAQESFDALPLRDAVGRLPRELKEVIILRYFTGLTLAETARTLDIPQGTAIITSFRQLFASLSTSVLIAVMAHASSNELGVDAFGFGVSFIVQAVVIALAFVAGMALMPKRTAR